MLHSSLTNTLFHSPTYFLGTKLIFSILWFWFVYYSPTDTKSTSPQLTGVESTAPSHLPEHQSYSPSQGERRGGKVEGGGGRVVGRGRGRGRGRVAGAVERKPGQVWGQSVGRGRGMGGRGKDS